MIRDTVEQGITRRKGGQPSGEIPVEPVGMIFNSRFSLVPQLRIPIRYGGGRDLSIIVRGSVNFGGN